MTAWQSSHRGHPGSPRIRVGHRVSIGPIRSERSARKATFAHTSCPVGVRMEEIGREHARISEPGRGPCPLVGDEHTVTGRDPMVDGVHGLAPPPCRPGDHAGEPGTVPMSPTPLSTTVSSGRSADRGVEGRSKADPDSTEGVVPTRPRRCDVTAPFDAVRSWCARGPRPSSLRSANETTRPGTRAREHPSEHPHPDVGRVVQPRPGATAVAQDDDAQRRAVFRSLDAARVEIGRRWEADARSPMPPGRDHRQASSDRAHDEFIGDPPPRSRM
jgi:hypothetical protein